MVKLEIYKPKERGVIINRICDNAISMVSQRLIIERTGLALKHLPLCQEQDADLIEEFIPRAKEGFALSMKPDWLYPSELARITKAAEPLTTHFPWQKLEIKEEDNTLPEWGHVLATLTYLAHRGRVSFADFTEEHIPDYRLNFLQSDWWTADLAPETIWNMMGEVEDLTRTALYDTESMGDAKLVKVGHFFAAGKELSKVFEI